MSVVKNAAMRPCRENPQRANGGRRTPAARSRIDRAPGALDGLSLAALDKEDHVNDLARVDLRPVSMPVSNSSVWMGVPVTRNGIQQRIAMDFTGHKTDSVFRRYDIVSLDDLRVAVERLNAIR